MEKSYGRVSVRIRRRRQMKKHEESGGEMKREIEEREMMWKVRIGRREEGKENNEPN